ncbi:MAG: DsrE family protein [Thermodesulfobacteriota bacterium]
MKNLATLGLLVSTDRCADHLIGLVKAAAAKGIKSLIFFTHRGVRLVMDPRLQELVGLAEMSFCRISLEAYGLKTDPPLPGLSGKSVSNQSGHARLIERCDRYLAL